MRVRKDGDRSYQYGGRFTGTAEIEMIIEASVPTSPDIARVRFSDGAVTNWHGHPGGQVLYLLAGSGRAGAGAEVHDNLAPGAVVETPENESHWHGAAAGSDATWLAITWGTTDWHDEAPLGLD